MTPSADEAAAPAPRKQKKKRARSANQASQPEDVHVPDSQVVATPAEPSQEIVAKSTKTRSKKGNASQSTATVNGVSTQSTTTVAAAITPPPTMQEHETRLKARKRAASDADKDSETPDVDPENLPELTSQTPKRKKTKRAESVVTEDTGTVKPNLCIVLSGLTKD